MKLYACNLKDNLETIYLHGVEFLEIDGKMDCTKALEMTGKGYKVEM